MLSNILDSVLSCPLRSLLPFFKNVSHRETHFDMVNLSANKGCIHKDRCRG